MGDTQTIRADTSARQHMQSATPEELADEYLSDQLPPSARQFIAGFMKRYGIRGLGEIDIGRARWREDPPTSWAYCALSADRRAIPGTGCHFRAR